jgi:hypothetical protein
MSIASASKAHSSDSTLGREEDGEPLVHVHNHPRLSLYTVEVDDEKVGKEYIPFFEDVIRMVCIQLAINFMLYLSGTADFLSWDMITAIAYIVFGVMLYWLGFRTLVSFK